MYGEYLYTCSVDQAEVPMDPLEAHYDLTADGKNNDLKLLHINDVHNYHKERFIY